MDEPDRTQKAPPRPHEKPAAGRDTGAWERLPAVAVLPEYVGRYRVTELLGEGGFGRVYRGFDPSLARDVAIKVPLRHMLTDELRERFLREARAAATIHHPNVCPIYDVGTDGDLPFIVMHFVAGGTLAGLLAARPSRLPPLHAIAIARKLALGLEAAHARGVIHRDLKPQNVLWEASRRSVLITDFGLARVAGDAALTPERQVFGTLAYMSPEQAAGRNDEVGPHSDVYTLGVILYEMLTGRPPFSGTVYELLWKVVNDSPPPPSAIRSSLDSRLDGLCAKAMEKRIGDRYATARELADALADYLNGGSAETAGVVVGVPIKPDEAGELAGASEHERVGEAPAREAVVCPACRTWLGVSWGRTKPVACPVCRGRFDIDAGREAALAGVAATASEPRADRSPESFGEPEPRPLRSRPVRRNWTSAICGLVVSSVGLLFAAGAGVAYVAFTTGATDAESDIPLGARLAPVVGLLACAAGRWWASYLPARVPGAVAASTSALGLVALAGAVGYTTLVTTPAPLTDPPSLALGRVYAGFTACSLVAVLGEVVFTLYFTGIGRELDTRFPRRSTRAARNRLCYLLCAVALGGGALMLLSGADHGRAAATGLRVVAVVGGVASVVLALYYLLSMLVLHLQAVAAMLRDTDEDD